MVAGLVVITPCAGHVLPWSSIVIGLLGGGVCYFGCRLKNVFKYDDSLDAFGVHGVGGALGALLVGIFAVRPAMGGGEQFMKQLVGVGVCAVFAFVLTFILALIIHKTVGLRATEEQEYTGLDLSLHGERGYHLEDDMFAGAADTAEGHPDARGTAAVGAPTTAH
jgi:Amt family ammonium transporter